MIKEVAFDCKSVRKRDTGRQLTVKLVEEHIETVRQTNRHNYVN